VPAKPCPLVCGSAGCTEDPTWSAARCSSPDYTSGLVETAPTRNASTQTNGIAAGPPTTPPSTAGSCGSTAAAVCISPSRSLPHPETTQPPTLRSGNPPIADRLLLHPGDTPPGHPLHQLAPATRSNAVKQPRNPDQANERYRALRLRGFAGYRTPSQAESSTSRGTREAISRSRYGRGHGTLVRCGRGIQTLREPITGSFGRATDRIHWAKRSGKSTRQLAEGVARERPTDR
jgi:hypothetical protein